MAAPGIYRILNVSTWQCYVGSAALCTNKRFVGHKSALRRGKHPNRHLQRAWAKFGELAFRFEILETLPRCSHREVLEREQFWIDILQAADRDYGYNVLPVAGSRLGVPASEEQKRKNGLAHRGKVTPLVTRERMRATALGRIITAEARAKTAETLRALWRDPAYRARMMTARDTQRYRDSMAENRRKNSERRRDKPGFFRGRTHSAESRAKMSAASTGRIPWNKGKKSSDEAKRKFSATRTGVPWSEARREAARIKSAARASATPKGATWSDVKRAVASTPEYKAKIALEKSMEEKILKKDK